MNIGILPNVNSVKTIRDVDKNAVAVVKVVSQLGCVSQDSELLDSQRGAGSRGNPMKKVLGPNRRIRLPSLRFVKQVSGKRNDQRWEKINVKVPHQRSPHAMKFEDRSHEETERQQRRVRSKAWNLAKNIYKLKEKDKAAFQFPAEEWVLLAASTKRAGGKKVCS